jgi:hypothetical protein
MASFGVVILGIGALVGESLGVEQQTGALLFLNGLRLSLIFLTGYVLSLVLDYFASKGKIPKSPPFVSKSHK